MKTLGAQDNARIAAGKSNGFGGGIRAVRRSFCWRCLASRRAGQFNGAMASRTARVANAAARNHGRKRSGLEPAEPRRGPASNHPWTSASLTSRGKRSLRQSGTAASTDWTDQAASLLGRRR